LRHNRPKFARDGQSARRGNTREFRFGLIIVSVCLLNTASAQTQIHKCTDADGGVAYSQLPCAPQKSVEAEKTEPDAKAESTPPASEIPPEEPELETNGSACKKHYRDAIDAIDAEIGREYSPDKAEQYKQQLLLLTRKLRQC
jgi:hypothetical protein